MTELFEIRKITVGEDKLCARVLVNANAPLMTSEDIEATSRVYYLSTDIADHLCLGDSGEKFQDCMGHTELPHLLEHLSVEIMNKTGLAGTIACGRTRGVVVDDRLFDVELSCPDDVLAIGALSSAAFMMDWAFLYPEQPAPNFEATVDALRNLVLSLRGEGEGAPADADTEEGSEGDVTAEEAAADKPADAEPDASGAAEKDADAAVEDADRR